MKSINVYWYKLPNSSTNYGDELNNFIVKELTGLKVNYIRFPYRWYKIPIHYFYNRLRGRISRDFKGMIRSMFANKILISIGSILHIYDRKGIIVWGSGIIKEKNKIHTASFRAVRGYETLREIGELGYDTNIPVGDPAILLPLLLPPSPKKYMIGVIPHLIHYEEISKTLLSSTVFTVINLKEDVKNITEHITSCQYVISSSLHGIIVAQSYGIPALWANFGLNVNLYGDDVKFKDYFSTVGVNQYKSIDIKSFDKDFILNLFHNNLDKALTNRNITQIQDGLLKAFPYKLKDKYIR